MSCNHKRRVVIAEGTWPRRGKHLVVQSDTVRVTRCNSCGAIKLDSFNEFVFSGGFWSNERKANLDGEP